MIYQVSGDILLTEAQVIVHGVAANDPMNQGLALLLHEKYPSMHKDYHHWCHHQHPKAGSAWAWGGPDGVRIVNLITQEGGYGKGAHPGKASVKHVRASLKELVKMVQRERFSSIALPRLATGVGGLAWEEVEPLIEDILGGLDIPVYVYVEYHAHTQAKEPVME